MTETTPLTRRFPEVRELPRIPLADLPTPVEHLDALGDAIDVPDLYVKRDDQTGSLYGGNKVRKLEYLLGAARKLDCDAVWTAGGIGSNHVLATCLYARQQGFEPRVLHFPQPVTDHVLDNLRVLSTTRPKLRLVSGQAAFFTAYGIRKTRDLLGMDPSVYRIPLGGSSPTGVVGYVEAALELVEQIRQGVLPEPDVIVVAVGTCGTLTGLALGCRLAGLDVEILGVRVTRSLYANRWRCRWLGRRTASRLERYVSVSLPRLSRRDFTLLHEYFGEDYGRPTEAGRSMRKLVREHTDLTLEPTYTAKALAAVRGERTNRELRDRTVLYWHTLNGVDLSQRAASADVSRNLPGDYLSFFERSGSDGRTVHDG